MNFDFFNSIPKEIFCVWSNAVLMNDDEKDELEQLATENEYLTSTNEPDTDLYNNMDWNDVYTLISDISDDREFIYITDKFRYENKPQFCFLTDSCMGATGYTARFFIDEKGELRAKEINDDKTYHYLFRTIKEDVSSDERMELLKGFNSGKTPYSEIEKHTTSAGEYIIDYFGLESKIITEK